VTATIFLQNACCPVYNFDCQTNNSTQSSRLPTIPELPATIAVAFLMFAMLIISVEVKKN
jgi:hypothetical protein